MNRSLLMMANSQLVWNSKRKIWINCNCWKLCKFTCAILHLFTTSKYMLHIWWHRLIFFTSILTILLCPYWISFAINQVITKYYYVKKSGMIHVNYCCSSLNWNLSTNMCTSSFTLLNNVEYWFEFTDRLYSTLRNKVHNILFTIQIIVFTQFSTLIFLKYTADLGIQLKM